MLLVGRSSSAGVWLSIKCILEDHHQRLIEAFALDDTFDRIEGPLALDLRIHLGANFPVG